MREIVLDTETSGLSHKTGDRVIEVGCVELVNHIPTGNNLQFYCSTEKKIDEIYHDHLVKDFVGLEKIIKKYL